MADDRSRGDGGLPPPDEPGAPVDPWASGDPAETLQGPAKAGESRDAGTGAGPEGLEETVIGGPEPVKPDLGPSGTSVMPAVSGAEPVPPRWSARAQVRPPEPDDVPGPSGGDWDEGDPPRGAFTPVLIGVAVIVLLALVGLGLWLALRDRDGSPTVPAPTASTAPATSGAATTRPPATATAPPTTAPPASVPIPNLEGQDFNSAASILTGLGLVPQRSDEVSASVPAGRVIGTNPPAGNQVARGTTISIRVSSGPPRTTPPPATRTPTPSPS